MRAWWCLILVAAALSGCVGGDAAPEPEPAPRAERHTLAGDVLTPAFNPIPGVRVELDQPGTVLADETETLDVATLTATTDATGRFVLDGVWPGDRTLRFVHGDYEAASQTVRIPADGNLTVVLTPISRIVPYQAQFPFTGYMECAVDHLIFAGSCDEFAGAVVEPVQGTFADEREFTFDLDVDWRTLVVDIAFDPLPPTLEALRLAAYAPQQEAEVLTYERYAAASGPEPFTLRIEPGVDYGDALPAPDNATTIRLEVFPQGALYHDLCDPSGGTCFTGVGASARIDFELIATAFYHEPAPEGWSLLDA